MDDLIKNRICLVYNFAQHYRENIFRLMDKELSIDFVFGDKYLDVRKMDYSLLKNFKREVKNYYLFNSPIYYQHNVLSLLRENYNSYLLLGESICLSTWIFLLLSKVFNKKVYLWTHGWYGKESFARRLAKKFFFSMADGIFLYGTYAKRLMIKNGFYENKLHVIYNSLNYDNQIQIRDKLIRNDIYKNHFKNNSSNLIFIGRLTKVKRLDLALEALNLLKKEGKFYNLTFIGEGENKENLLNHANSLGLSNCVWFYGESYDENELSNLIFNADLCVSPGNVGLTAIHSMTYGTPVVTHDNFPYQMPEFEAIEFNKTGSFFIFNSAESLAETIQKWFNDNTNREIIRENCFNVVDTKYNPHQQLKIFKQHLT